MYEERDEEWKRNSDPKMTWLGNDSSIINRKGKMRGIMDSVFLYIRMGCYVSREFNMRNVTQERGHF